MKIPTVPKPSVTATVKVLRRMGYLGLAPDDAAIFKRLRRIFPVLSAWVPKQAPDCDWEGAEVTGVSMECPEEARFELAQSVLLLNVSGQLSEALLRDAAWLGVPCVGTEAQPAQSILWPQVTVQAEDEAIAIGRRLLTDAAFANRTAEAAREACRLTYSPDGQEIAAWLRRLHAAQNQATVAPEQSVAAVL